MSIYIYTYTYIYMYIHVFTLTHNNMCTIYLAAAAAAAAAAAWRGWSSAICSTARDSPAAAFSTIIEQKNFKNQPATQSPIHTSCKVYFCDMVRRRGTPPPPQSSGLSQFLKSPARCCTGFTQ